MKAAIFYGLFQLRWTLGPHYNDNTSAVCLKHCWSALFNFGSVGW